MSQSYYVYILRCSDGSFYTGYTQNLEKRLEQHRNGIGSKFVRSRRPVELIYQEEYKSRGGAMRREREIKKLSRKEKERVVGKR